MEEKLTFPNSKGQKLSAVLNDPTGDKSKPIIIFCHGYDSSKDRDKPSTLQKLLGEKGIPFFRFDFLGNGESEGELKDLTISEGVDDLKQAIGFIKKKGFTKFGLIGSSFGGAVCIKVASQRPDLALLVLISAVADYQIFAGATEEEDRNPSFMEDAKKNNGFDVVDKISAPVLIVHGDKDEEVPVDHILKFAEHLKNPEIKIVKGAGHRYLEQKHFDELISTVSSFIINRL